MVFDIFSSFDPYINSSFSSYGHMFWAYFVVGLGYVQCSYWASYSKSFWLGGGLMEVMLSQANRTLSSRIGGMPVLVTSLFLLIILTNLLGLIPYAFSVSSHLVMSLTFGLPLWLMIIMSSVSFSPNSFVASLLPGGAPDWLNPFLVIVETISISVRPLTLSFRLTANMTAGHIILALCGVYASSYLFLSVGAFLGMMVVQMGYMLFEVGVCFIQGYIFCLLLTLYADEHTS